MPHARVIVFGYGELALAALDTLARLAVTPVAVVVPGNRRGPDVDLVAAAARSRGLDVLVQPPRASLQPFLDDIQARRPDLLFVWSYSMLLPPGLIALAPLGAVNLHGGLLPQYRGGHVMNWAIANGETESGATLAYLDDGIDTGPVIAERRFAITMDDDAASVREKIRAAGESLIEQWWPAIEDGTAPAVPQDETRAAYYRMRTAEDGRIDWSQPALSIHNLVRALVSPWPGAFTVLGDATLVVRRSRPLPRAESAVTPGTVTGFDEAGIRVATGAGSLELLSVEVDGQPMAHADLARAGLAVGVHLG